MTRIFTRLITDNIDNDKYVVLVTPFIFESDVLKKAGLPYIATIPIGFVMDFESVPWVRGTNRRAGAGHDYFCRSDSIPVVTKAIAAAVYLELMAYTYEIEDRGLWQHFRDFTKRWFKWAVVYVAPGYFHKFKVMASALEIAGIKDDPYVTVEQLQAEVKNADKIIDMLEQAKVEQTVIAEIKSDVAVEEKKKADNKIEVLDTKIDIATDAKKEKEDKIEVLKEEAKI